MPFAYSNDCNVRQIGTTCVRGVIVCEYNWLKKPRMNSTICTHIRSPPSLPLPHVIPPSVSYRE